MTGGKISTSAKALKLARAHERQGILKLRAEGLSVPASGGLRKSCHAPVVA